MYQILGSVVFSVFAFTFAISNAQSQSERKPLTQSTLYFPVFSDCKHGSRRRGVGATHSGAEDAPRYDHARLWYVIK